MFSSPSVRLSARLSGCPLLFNFFGGVGCGRAGERGGGVGMSQGVTSPYLHFLKIT